MLAPVVDGLKAHEYIMERYLQTCRESDILPDCSPEERRMKEMVNLNFRWFMQTLLDRKDRMSMGCGLEVRVPFCDCRIAEYLYGVPWEFKNHGNKEKGLLRQAVEGLLPEEVLWRKKSPYPKTFDPMYRQLVAERLQTLLQDQTAPIWHLVSKEEARKLLSAEPIWPWYGQLMRGPQTMAYLLQVDFWLRHYRVEMLF
jgi:asparagine synthase (glutamine-hydrolysing)